MISFKGMGRFSLIVAALTALLALAGCSGIPLIPNQPIPGVQPDRPMKTWDPTPEPSTESPAPSWTPEPTQTTESPYTQEPVEGNLAQFEHFNVRVMATAGREEDFDIQAEVCVTKAVNSKGTRISSGPWSVTTNDGKVRKAETDPEFSEANFPKPKLYDQDECARGWLHFPSIDGTNIREIGYANSLGDQALWDDGGIRI